VAITDGEPYLFTGSHPSNVNYEKLENGLAGLPASAIGTPPYTPPMRAVAATTGGIVYASREGPVAVRGGQVTPLGRSLFTREDWAQRYQAHFGTMRFCYYDGNLLAYAKASQPLFIVNMVDGDPRFTRFDNVVGAGDFVLPSDDSLYLLSVSGSTSSLVRFADENTNRLMCTWQSKEFILPRPVSFAAGQVLAWGSGSLLVSIRADGTIWHERTLTFASTSADGAGAIAFRIPAGIKARRWSVTLTSLASGASPVIVREFHLAETMQELANV
jgi:hypothetical protein